MFMCSTSACIHRRYVEVPKTVLVSNSVAVLTFFFGLEVSVCPSPLSVRLSQSLSVCANKCNITCRKDMWRGAPMKRSTCVTETMRFVRCIPYIYIYACDVFVVSIVKDLTGRAFLSKVFFPQRINLFLSSFVLVVA